MASIKVTKEFKMGSKYFFSCYKDFKPHDEDILGLMSKGLSGKKSFLFRKDGKDLILYPILTKEEYIQEDIKLNDPIRVGKYLIPEFVEFIDFTIDDLKLFSKHFDNLDSKHKYEKIIYDAYVENDDFVLTDAQRRKAYEEYKKARLS